MYYSISQFFPTGNDLGSLVQVLFSLLFLVYLFYAQRIQVTMMLKQVEGAVIKLKVLRDQGRQAAVRTVSEIGKPTADISPRIDQMIEQFVITPVDLDPAGIVRKLEQLMNVRELTFEEDVKEIAPQASLSEVHNLEMLIESAMALNAIYKVIRHFYLLGKKTMNLYVIMQVQMVLPLIMQEVDAYASALQACVEGAPIGDGAGALMAARMMRGYPNRVIAKDTVVAEVPYEQRMLLVLKAMGPGGNVGKPGEAIANLLEERGGKVAKIVMVDAAGKLEGEEAGSIAEGIGAAIGGIGVDKYKIEEVAVKYNVPVHAVAIKEDIKDTISPMKEAIVDGAEKAVEVVKRFVRERTKEGDVLIVAGIGNTMGIAQ